MATTLTTIDHQAQAESRLLSQYNNAENLKKYLSVYIEQLQELENVFQSFLTKFTITGGAGDQLDVIGLIVDQSRVLTDAGLYPWFGPDTAAGSLGYGDANDPDNTTYLGGRFRAFSEAVGTNELLTDSDYRIFLQAKIEGNGGGTTIEEVIANIKSIFQLTDLEPVTVLNKTLPEVGYDVTIGRQLTDFEKSFITGSSIVLITAGATVDFFDLNGPIE